MILLHHNGLAGLGGVGRVRGNGSHVSSEVISIFIRILDTGGNTLSVCVPVQ